jgi:hypothetical protein
MTYNNGHGSNTKHKARPLVIAKETSQVHYKLDLQEKLQDNKTRNKKD